MELPGDAHARRHDHGRRLRLIAAAPTPNRAPLPPPCSSIAITHACRKHTAIRKSTELKRITYEKKLENPLQYGPFSERVLELIQRFEAGQLEAAELLKEMERVAKDLQEEEHAYKDSGLNERAYGVYKILAAFRAAVAGGGESGSGGGETGGGGEDRLKQLASRIDDVYGSDDTAPVGWHLKEQLRKDLRGQVRRIVHPAGLQNWKDIPVGAGLKML